MTRTITCRYLGRVESGDHADTIGYLTKIGMNFRGGIDNLLLMIEVRNMPEILTVLEQVSNYDHLLKERTMKDKSEEVWDILRMCDAGISFYVTNWQPADGVIFIPRENIIAIHTLSKEFVAKRSDVHKAKAAGGTS